MGAVVGLGLGVGLLLCWSVVAVPRAARGPRRAERTEALLARAGLAGVSSASVWALCLACALVALLAGEILTRTPPVAVVFALLAGYLPVGVLAGRARRRQREFAEVWPEAVDNLASAVRAGLSLPESLAGLAVRGPAALREPFEQFALDYQVSGRFGDCLDRLKDCLADPVGDRVVEGLRIAREVGGGELGRLLRNLSSYLRAESRTRAELESRQAWAVNGARLAVAAPWLVLLFLSFQPDVIQRYSSAAGVVVLAGGAAACLIAYRVMLRIGRLPTERRILR
ncbi:type II secretion system F family protein [Nocardioides sp. BP30]|uniref:type II secretion system F family protein n=1 Tax=Nocardioides sp. BP30 TaxID=3036374 RepID=UPI00246940CE|nr:type II secretion system F family protein [Nocardioides sp. BP30]WGL53501.1 type II secretion system F family protein [Nocardioides sp. BP30]